MSINKKIFVGAFVAALALLVAPANAAYVHTVTLKVGSNNSQVMMLQQTLNANGFLVSASGAGSPGMETTTFGPKTKAAVMAFQSAKGLTPVDGIVGHITGTALQALTGTTGGNTGGVVVCPAGYVCQPTGGNTNSGGSLSGTFGTISDVNKISSYNGEEVGESESGVKVMGFDVEASKSGDVGVQAVKLAFDYNGSGSTRLDKYIDSVTVWEGSTKVGSADVSDFNRDSSGMYTLTLALNNAVVKSGATSSFYVSVDAASSLDSNDIGATSDWYISLDNIRYVDGSGATTTDTSTGDIGGSLDNVGINFVSFATAADTEFRITKDSDSPDAGIAIVDDNDTTNDVVLLKGQIRLKGTSDATLNELPVTFTTTGDGLADISDNVTLVLDGKEFGQSTVATTAGSSTITFDNLDFSINAGDTIDFEVRADILGSSGNYTEGDTVLASITSDNRSNADVENEEYDQVSDSNKTGTAIGLAQELRSQGVSVSLVSTSATETSTNSTTTADYKIKFKVSAVGDDVYIGTIVGDYGFSVQDSSGTATTAGVSKVISISDANGNDTSTTANAAGWKIADGTSVTVTLEAFASSTGISSGAYRAVLSSIKWDTDGTDATLANTYSSNLEDFHTDYEPLD